MLSDPLKETLDFIKSFFKKHDRPPRLKELQAKLNKTNKAILDRLKNLEKEGFIEMPDGVLSMRLRGNKNDVFISYSSDDKEDAQKIYDHFKDEGFEVWKDNISLDCGDNFIPKIFDNIRQSKVFIILLSKSALNSKFVREEVACAKKSYIDNEVPIILPVKLKSDFNNKEVFSEISSINHFKLAPDFSEEDLMHLADKIHKLAYEHRESTKKESNTPKGLAQFIKKAHDDIAQEVKDSPPPVKEYPYIELILAPIGDRKKYKNFEIEKIVRESIVKIQGWGGDRFPPYYYDYGHNAQYMSGGIRNADMKAWPERDWGLAYWAADKNLNFIAKSVLRETFSKREGLEDKFSIEWLILDVVRSLMFLKNLIDKSGIKRWKFDFKYSGVRGRELVLLSTRRFGLMSSYKTRENILPYKIEIDEHKDLKQIAFDICFDILTIFNWRNPNEEMLWKDINTLFDDERFPD